MSYPEHTPTFATIGRLTPDSSPDTVVLIEVDPEGAREKDGTCMYWLHADGSTSPRIPKGMRLADADHLLVEHKRRDVLLWPVMAITDALGAREGSSLLATTLGSWASYGVSPATFKRPAPGTPFDEALTVGRRARLEATKQAETDVSQPRFSSAGFSAPAQLHGSDLWASPPPLEDAPAFAAHFMHADTTPPATKTLAPFTKLSMDFGKGDRVVCVDPADGKDSSLHRGLVVDGTIDKNGHLQMTFDPRAQFSTPAHWYAPPSHLRLLERAKREPVQREKGEPVTRDALVARVADLEQQIDVHKRDGVRKTNEIERLRQQVGRQRESLDYATKRIHELEDAAAAIPWAPATMASALLDIRNLLKGIDADIDNSADPDIILREVTDVVGQLTRLRQLTEKQQNMLLNADLGAREGAIDEAASDAIAREVDLQKILAKHTALRAGLITTIATISDDMQRLDDNELLHALERWRAKQAGVINMQEGTIERRTSALLALADDLAALRDGGALEGRSDMDKERIRLMLSGIVSQTSHRERGRVEKAHAEFVEKVREQLNQPSMPSPEARRGTQLIVARIAEAYETLVEATSVRKNPQ